MPVPSNITLTPNSGVAPFYVKITGTNLFERPYHVARERFTANAESGQYTITAADVVNNVITMPGGADAPPEGQAIIFWQGVGAITIGGVSQYSYAYYGAVQNYYYVRRVTDKTFTVSTYSDPTPLAIAGGFTSAVFRYAKMNDEGYGIGPYDCLNNGWQGSQPTRGDCIIGKGLVCVSGANNFMRTYQINGPSSPNTASAGSNNLFPRRYITGKVFVSLWVYVPGPITAQIPLIHMYRSNSSGTTHEGPGNTTPQTQSDFVSLYVTSTGRVAGCLNGKHTNGTNAAKKWVYTETGVLNASAWNHVLFQWNGVALDPPEIWTNSSRKPITVQTNELLGGFTWVSTDGFDTTAHSTAYTRYAENRIGYFTVYNGDTPVVGSDVASYAPANTKFCDIYVGNEYLTEANVLKYANLPKVELIRV